MRKLIDFIGMVKSYLPQMWKISGHSKLVVMMAGDGKEDRKLMTEMGIYIQDELKKVDAKITKRGTTKNR